MKHCIKILVSTVVCLTLVGSMAAVAFADDGLTEEPVTSAADFANLMPLYSEYAGITADANARAITYTTGSFVRVSALKGKLTISATSSIVPDRMYAKVMLQRNVNGTWSNSWSDYVTVSNGSGGAMYGSVSTITVGTSGTYRCKVYVYEVNGGTTNIAGPSFSQSVSL